MSAARAPRRPRRPRAIRRGAAGRRRPLVVLGALVVLLALAALIGSRADDGGGRGTEASAPASTKADRQVDGRASADSAGSATGDEAMPSTTMVAPAPTLASPSDAVTAGADTGASGSTATEQVQLAGAPADAKIIRTGSLQVVVAKGQFGDGNRGLARIATGLGGFVSASEISSFDDDPQGTVTLRIPASKFDQALAEIGKLGTVRALTTGSQDVTGEYTDVASRLKALQAEREQINLVLSRAESIPDILSVRDRLAAVQGEIEQYQGRQKVLDDQTSLSTLTVDLSEKGSTVADTKPPAERTGFSKLWHDSTDRFTDGGRSIALGLATMAPWLLLLLVLWLPARLLWRRLVPVAGDEVGGGLPPTATATD